MNDEMLSAFELLNSKLNDNNLYLDIVCVGGYVMHYYGFRATADIDAFYESNQTINRLIYEVGDELGINGKDEVWLNDSVSNLNSAPPERVRRSIYDMSNLKVSIVSLMYLFGMKIQSGRSRDRHDLAEILLRENLDDPVAVYEEMLDLGFRSIDFSILLEAFNEAYGDEWMQNYFAEHQEELFRYY